MVERLENVSCVCLQLGGHIALQCLLGPLHSNTEGREGEREGGREGGRE